jgi:hypothetical protein
MNHRRGFQCLYLVCCILWVTLVLIVSIRNRPRTIDYDALAKKAGAIEVDPSDVTPLPAQPQSTVPFVPPPLDSDKGPLRLVKSEPLPGVKLSYWLAHSAVALLPPLLVYLFLFHVLPWVFRGFKPATQISRAPVLRAAR